MTSVATLEKNFAQLRDGSSVGKKRQNIVYKRMHGEQRDADHLAADQWILKKMAETYLKVFV